MREPKIITDLRHKVEHEWFERSLDLGVDWNSCF